MLVEAGYELGGAHAFAAVDEDLAAQRGLQAGHEERGGNSFTGNVGDGDSQMRGAELNEVVVVAADGARSFADGFDFNAGNVRQNSGKELVLHFPRDGNFVFEALALLLFFDQAADGTRHEV